MTPMEEQISIKATLRGDSTAFEKLFRANERNVYNLALKMLKNPEDALDISQEAFIKAYQSLSDFRADSRFSVWIYRITYNMCVDFLRKKAKYNETQLTVEDEDGSLTQIELPDLRNLPEDAAVRKELRKTIRESIEELPQNHREIFMLREVTDMSYADIADVLGISEGTVKSRIARARNALIKILLQKGTFPSNYRHTNGSENYGEVGDEL